MSVDLQALIDDPAHVPTAAIPGLLALFSSLQSTLAARLLSAGVLPAHSDPDHLLTVTEAAQRLQVSQDWLYRHAGGLPFTVRVGRYLRFSSSGIDRYIHQQAGRAA